MSKPRYDWWPYVKGMVRRYPALRAEYAELHRPSVTGQLASIPGGGWSRSVENCALRDLPSTKQREYEAVRRAVEATAADPHTGQTRLKLIELMYWAKSHTLEGAAMSIHCSYATARRYHTEFIYMVATCYGLLDEE